MRNPWAALLSILFVFSAPTAATAATFVVNSPLDAVDVNRGDGTCATAGGVCTLRAAIQEANALTGASVITLPAGTYALTIAGRNELSAATGDLNIGSGKDITINGAGLGSTIIDANGIDRVFQSAGGRLTLTDLTVRNGNPGTAFGGGIYMDSGSTLTITRSVVSGNTTGPSGGGAIIMFGSTLTLTETTISGNTTQGAGGGIDLGSGVNATITRSTISGNTATSGAGLDFFAPGGPSSTLTISNSTISGNTATSGGGSGVFMTGTIGSTITITNSTIASNSSGGGGAIVNSGTGLFQIRNSVIANNTAASSQNCSGLGGGVFTDRGNNVEFPGTTCGFGAASDRRADPLLGPLGSNGGLTQTHALGPGSPAIDLGDPATCAASPVSGLDQRGFTRPSTCDAGAVEFGAGPTMSLDRTSLVFGAVSNGAQLTSQTPSQTVRLRQSGGGTVTWTVASNSPWLTVTPASGSGAAVLNVAVKFDSTLPASGTLAGNITLTLTGAGNTVGPIASTLNLFSSAAAASPPFGSFDTPAGDATVLAGSVAITGWTLDNIGVKQVELWRDMQPGETTPPGNTTPGDLRNGKIYIANATFVDNARPDVEGLNPTVPANHQAGWGYLMLTWGLFGQGNGTYRFYAFGVDQEGNTATIGTKTVIISNNTATRPFGSIDTPAIGGDASGPNFGWGLTPRVNGVATCKIQPSGVQYSIDSGPLQPVIYGDARSDIAGAFPGFSNTAGAGGYAIVDWSALTNGPHTIGWLITDDCNRADGVGSRFFNVTGGTSSLTAPPFRLKAEATHVGSAVALSFPEASAFRRNGAEGEASAFLTSETPGRRSFSEGGSAKEVGRNESRAAVLLARGYGELSQLVEPDVSGARTIEVKQGERIELRLPRGFDTAYQLGPAATPRQLPIGSTWDAASGIFYWQPAPGFLGPFRLVFSNGRERIAVSVVVTP